ncbi:MAG: hypothetical protein V4660_02205 [Pseudomonadota bacterium]
MLKHFFSIALIAVYPALVHASVIFAMPGLQVVAVIFFLLGIFWPSLLRGRLIPWIVFSVLTTAILLLGYFKLTLYLLYLTPIVIPLALLIFFGRTLLAGRIPLITAISDAARGPLTPAMQKYTRLLTQLWCVIFLILILWSIILAFLQRPDLWSWFTNVINYGLVGAFFVIEFMVRKKLFPEHNHPSFLQYIRIIIKADIRQ